jgi:RHS repeat-associated protein
LRNGLITRRTEAGTTTAARQYIGQYFDPSSNLNYLNARYYDGAQGQFISQDPVFPGSPSQQNLQDPQLLNAYSYSEDNPITKKDPLGKYWDFSSSFTISDPFQPELPGPSFSLDLQVDRSGGYALNLQGGFGWGAYGNLISAYHVPGPVTNENSPTIGSDVFLASLSSTFSNGVYTPQPTGWGCPWIAERSWRAASLKKSIHSRSFEGSSITSRIISKTLASTMCVWISGLRQRSMSAGVCGAWGQRSRQNARQKRTRRPRRRERFKATRSFGC